MNKKNKISFKKAIESNSDLAKQYQTGLNALGKYKSKIHLTDGSLCEGSVDIDNCLLQKYPNSNRWDYVFSYEGEAYFVEVHSAETSEVGTVIKKLVWLKDWLIREASVLNSIKAKKPYYWIQSNSFHILPKSPQYRLAVQNGILPISKLKL